MDQAILFIDEMGTFYPFGTTLNKAGTAIPLSVYLDKEIETTEIVIILENSIQEKFDGGEITAAAIIIDVNFRASLNEKLRQAIQIKMVHLTDKPLTYYLLYSSASGKCVIDKCLYY